MPRGDKDSLAQERAQRLAQMLERIAAQGMTQRQVALELNVPPNYLSDLKRGHRHLTEQFARRFADVYRVSTTWLLWGQGPVDLPDGVATPARAAAGVYALPVLSTPWEGDPRESGAWDGSMVSVTGAAAAAAERARQPYALRMDHEDPLGRLRKNDLVLCSQEPRKDATVVLVRVGGRVVLARKDSADQVQPFHSHKSLSSPTVIGCCIGIIWGLL